MEWKDVEIGKQYKYEEGYDLQAIVTILDKKIEDNGITIHIRIDKGIHGIETGKELKVFKNTKPEYSYLVIKNKFLSMEEDFTYYNISCRVSQEAILQNAEIWKRLAD